MDVCDDKSRFGLEVPQRAAHYPVIASAILALASQHLSVLRKTEDKESAAYYSRSLQILIPFLDDPLGALDENLLAAIVILRTYEERHSE